MKCKRNSSLIVKEILICVDKYNLKEENSIQISGNTILITGKTSGIGVSLQKRFMLKVIITGSRKHLLNEATAMNPGMRAAILDVEDNDAIAQFSSAATDVKAPKSIPGKRYNPSYFPFHFPWPFKQKVLETSEI